MDMRRNILPGNGRFRIPEQFLLIFLVFYLCTSTVTISLFFFIIKEIVNSVTKSINHYMNRMLVIFQFSPSRVSIVRNHD